MTSPRPPEPEPAATPDAGPELFARLAAGDERVFDTIFREWYPHLVRAVNRIVRDDAVAEEIGQDVMLELWRRREQMASEEAPRAYLFRAARNRALNHVRHLRIERRDSALAVTRTEESPRGTDRLVEGELEAAIRESIDALPPRCREVFELSRVHGLTYMEIARVMEISVKTVEVQMGKALRTLRLRLAPWIGREPTRTSGRAEQE